MSARTAPDRIGNGENVPDAYVNTGSDGSIADRCA